MRSKTIILGILCIAVLFSQPALAERRVALVIGNSAYKNAFLKNPVNDAREMASALRKLGFSVTLLTDATLQQMDDAVVGFGTKLGTDVVALFYFAGHGIQVGGENYLVPINASIQTESDAKFGCLHAGRVLGKMEDAGNRVNVVILDACRSNPFGRGFRSSELGLAEMRAPTGSIVAYATAPGKVAADGSGKNGLYTQHLLQHISTPGLSVTDLFMNVREAVVRDSNQKQIPWENTSLIGRFYFAGGAQVASPTSASLQMDLKTEKARVAEEAERLKREQQELNQLQVEKQRLEAERQKVEKAKLTLAPVPKSPPQDLLTAPVGSLGKTWTDRTTGMEFLWVPSGKYVMGCGPWAGDCGPSAKPMNTVSVDGFWLGKYEVTQRQWQKVMGHNPSGHQMGGNYPVEQVSWKDTKEFIERLNDLGSARFRLPTEAEWEYAARSGGKAEKYSGGDAVERLAWHNSNSGGSTHPVGTKAPNGLGLYDMSGNVWEWCEDVQNTYGGIQRVFRGGSWLNEPRDMSPARRNYVPSSWRDPYLGFRLVRIP